MKIAILTSGILPVPAVRGGAVENLIDFYLEYNERHQLHDITVYSIADEAAKGHPALSAKLNHYCYIDTSSLLARIDKKIFHYILHNDGYYHYTIEYFLQKAMKHISKQHYDMIVLENRPGYALEMLGRTGAPMVYHLHNEKLVPGAAMSREIYGAATGIITVSDFIRKGVQAIHPDDTKTRTVHNGIDLAAFAPNGKADRSRLGLKDTDFVMVFSGRLLVEKGIVQLIEAMNQLSDLTRAKLLVIGSSFYGNGNSEKTTPFIDMLKDKAAGLQERIIFTGYVPYEQMPDYLHMADIAIVPSLWDEPFGLTCLEALAAGLPLITTRRGGIPEIATDECAILLGAADENLAGALASSIRYLYKTPDKRKKMSEAALRRSRLFDKEHYAREFFRTLEDIRI